MTGWVALTAFLFGLGLAALLSSGSDDIRIERGWMERRGKIYVLTPAKVEPAR